MRTVRLWLLALVLAASQSASVAAAQFQDDLGRTVEVPEQPQRVISLAPHLTELVFAAGAGDRLAGVVAYSDHPEAALALPVIGDAFAIDRERIARIRPDLILAWAGGNPTRVIRSLEEAGYPVVALESGSLERIPGQLQLLGRLLGSEAQARAAADAYREQLAAFGAARSGPPVPVFVQIAQEPLYTVGGPHMISELLERCGGINVFADLDTLAAQVSYEAVLERRPAMIVASLGDPQEDWRALWQRWPELPAVRDARLIGVDADHLSRPTPRILEGMRRICDALASG